MKKFLTFVFVILAFIQFGFSVDNQIDFFNQEPEKIVKDMSNKLKNGYIIKTGTYRYYGETINYTVNCKKDDPNDFFIFFTCTNQENLLDFYKDYLKDYIEQAYKIFYDVSFKEDEIQTTYTIHIDKKPVCDVYAKINLKYGIRGFGVTYRSKYTREKLMSADISSVAKGNFTNNIIKFLYDIDLSDIKTGICYLRNLDIPNSAKLGEVKTLKENEDYFIGDETGGVYFDTAVLVSSESTFGKYKIEIHCDNELKTDAEFQSLILHGNGFSVYSFKKILEKEIFYAWSFSEITKFKLDTIISKTLFEKMKNNFYIEITEVIDIE